MIEYQKITKCDDIHWRKQKFSKNKNYLQCQSMWLHIEKIQSVQV